MRIKAYSLFVSAVILTFACLTAVQAQPPGYHTQQMGGSGGSNAVRGKVFMPDGKPAARVRVTITSPDISGESTYTDESGEFKFGGLLKGNFTVTARAEGYPDASEYTTIDRGGPAGQSAQVIIYIRAEGQPKGAPANPMLANVDKEAVKKFEKAAAKGEKDFKGALQLLDEAIALDPKFALAHYEKGMIYQNQKDLDNALVSFTKALEAKPDYLEAKMAYGSTLLSMKNYELAAQVFQDVMKQKNDIPMVYLHFGQAMYGMNNLDMAEKAFKFSLTLKGGENLSITHRLLAAVYMDKKQNAAAIAELEKYIQMQPKAPDVDKLKATIEELKKKKG